MQQTISSKTGTAEIIKVGQTYSGAHGSEPNATVRGPAAGTPTPQNIAGK